MASPNTLRLNEEMRALRSKNITVTKSLLIYGANRKTRRSQLRQVYKESFLTLADAKRAVREEDQIKLEKVRRFTAFIQKRTRELQEEYAAKGEELTEGRAFELIKAEADEAFRKSQETLPDGEAPDAAAVQESFLFRGKGGEAEQII